MPTTTAVKSFGNYINGEWLTEERVFPSINPAAKKEVVGYFQASSENTAKKALDAASEAFRSWSSTAPTKRAAMLTKAADILDSRSEQIAEELTKEVGKPFGASLNEVKRSAETLRYYAVEGVSYTGETFPNDDPNLRVYTVKEPLGVITVITPWNFPLSIPARKIAPALITGNAVVFKPSSDSPLVGYRLVEALHEAGLPKGVLNYVTGSSREIGEILVKHPAVRGVTFTGSTNAGEQIHRSVSLTTRTQMELGGKNPLIVMEDADLDEAVQLTVNGGFGLSGQACTGTSRAIVMKSIKEEFTNRLVQKAKELKIADGFTKGVSMGPLANEKQLKNVLDYIHIGKNEGAMLLCGGEQLTGTGYDEGFYVSPAVFTDVTPGMRIEQEEIFGPVICVIEADDYEEAISIANNVEYGLSASIVTKQLNYIERFVKEAEAGTVKSNRTTTGNLMNAPFGGIKKSSTSTFRESGRVGLEFFTQTKTVYFGH
ncbi:aldehyde dehydrogenase family protein [Fictibacillus terranigra]|uniref:Aldehyde dehydrogenase family protein n=1 Tax=Fictibacillus terranigra TaxID=3058424 RepID=A0ABT8EDP8_9BACL|nr:aldehyde dehydrogenase family protein [Fictibacillus sp. CENA-BCM004]MDN4076046.1 aldehyde dehydrogenase family protein [Fictibacillus sp. CENA-BCM004]